MLKKNNTPLEEVMKTVAEENGFQYVNPENRKKREIVFIENNGETHIELRNKDNEWISGFMRKDVYKFREIIRKI